MKTITKEYNVYSYDELSEQSKEKVREMFGKSQADIETDILEDDFQYQTSEKHPYFQDCNFQWSLSYCQGDGLSFSCIIDINKFLEVYYPTMKASVFDAVCNSIYRLHSTGNKRGYCYASKSDIDFELDIPGNKKYTRIECKIIDIIDNIRNIYIQYCKELEKQGYSAYEYLYSDEYARELCSSNDYLFLDNGKLF